MFSKFNLSKSIYSFNRVVKYYFEPTKIINKNYSNIKFPKTNNNTKTNNQINLSSISNISNVSNDFKMKLEGDETNADLLDSNYGLRKFINKTYLWTGGAITSSIGISILGSAMQHLVLAEAAPEVSQINLLANLLNSFELFLGTGLGLSFCGILGISFLKPKMYTGTIINFKNGKVIPVFYTTNSIPRIISYGSLVSGMGILMIPMFIAFPDAILPAFVASSSVFGGAVYYGLTRQEEISVWGPTLYSSLTGLAGVSLLGLGSSLLFGQNWFGDSAHFISLYGGIPLFTGLISYDTYKAIERYKERDADHLGCSVDLYLNFINLFIRLVEIIAKIQAFTNKNDDK